MEIHNSPFPWKGGFYERMIGIMKSLLKRAGHKRNFKESEFLTIILECEAMVNSRTLTYTGSTVDDSLVLRPVDFLIPYANVNQFMALKDNPRDEDYLPSISTKDQAIQYFNKHLNYLEQLWRTWTQQYLLELRNFQKKLIHEVKKSL